MYALKGRGHGLLVLAGSLHPDRVSHSHFAVTATAKTHRTAWCYTVVIDRFHRAQYSAVPGLALLLRCGMEDRAMPSPGLADVASRACGKQIRQLIVSSNFN